MTREGLPNPDDEALYREFCKKVDSGDFNEFIEILIYGGKHVAKQKNRKLAIEEYENPRSVEELIRAAEHDKLVADVEAQIEKEGEPPPMSDEEMENNKGIQRFLETVRKFNEWKKKLKTDPIYFEKYKAGELKPEE